MIQFGTGGWRAIIGDGFTKANIQRVATALGRRIQREAESEKGLHEGYKRTVKRHLEKEESEQLDESPSSYTKLKNEVIYLQEEVEFLKKISQQVISGKRGK